MVTAYLVTHALAVVTTLASLAMALKLLGSNRTSQSTLAWLLALIFVPFVAIPLFLAVGSRKFPRTAKGPAKDMDRTSNAYSSASPASASSRAIANVLRTSGALAPRAGNSFEIIGTGEKAYVRLLDLIRASERSIDLTMFILGNDATGRAVVAALVERARAGVSVRVILDGVGSEPSHAFAARELTAASGEVRVFLPLLHSPIRGRTNLRSHRKLAVFDSAHVFAGGMNLANEYMGAALAPGAPPRWRDVAAVTSGPVAADAEALFESDWAFCGGAKRPEIKADRDAAEVSAHGDAIVQVVPSGPDMVTDTVYDLFLTGIFGARARVAIVTPYYVPDDLLQHALVLSARRGVRTELLVPSLSNHTMADVARRNLLRELKDAGVVIHYYGGGMVHAKAMVIDDCFAYVGSPNFDMRSLFLNYENALCVYSTDAIAQIRAYVDGLIAESTLVGPPDKKHVIFEQIARMLAPEL